MPVLIKCVLDGCLAKRNGGEECRIGNICRAVKMRKGPPDPGPREPNASEVLSAIRQLPAAQQAALNHMAMEFSQGRKVPTLSSCAEAARVGIHDVESALFSVRKIAAQLSSQ